MTAPASPALTVRGVTLARGRAPAVCVPLVASSPEEAARAAAAIPPGACDVVELRLDHLAGVGGRPALAAAAVHGVRAALPDAVPLLATFRTTREGGAQAADDAAYAAVVRASLAGADLVDVELRTEVATRDALLADAHAAEVPVVLSTHDFARTPPRDAIVALLREQQAAGGDVLKVAVAPHGPGDVLELLAATHQFTATEATRPVVTMAMGPVGVVSRVAGGVFGSVLTFASVPAAGGASAPGQPDAVALRAALAVLDPGARA